MRYSEGELRAGKESGGDNEEQQGAVKDGRALQPGMEVEDDGGKWPRTEGQWGTA